MNQSSRKRRKNFQTATLLLADRSAPSKVSWTEKFVLRIKWKYLPRVSTANVESPQMIPLEFRSLLCNGVRGSSSGLHCIFQQGGGSDPVTELYSRIIYICWKRFSQRVYLCNSWKQKLTSSLKHSFEASNDSPFFVRISSYRDLKPQFTCFLICAE